LHFFDIFAAEIKFLANLCFQNLKKYGGDTKNEIEFLSSQVEIFSGISKKLSISSFF